MILGGEDRVGHGVAAESFHQNSAVEVAVVDLQEGFRAVAVVEEELVEVQRDRVVLRDFNELSAILRRVSRDDSSLQRRVIPRAALNRFDGEVEAGEFRRAVRFEVNFNFVALRNVFVWEVRAAVDVRRGRPSDAHVEARLVRRGAFAAINRLLAEALRDDRLHAVVLECQTVVDAPLGIFQLELAEFDLENLSVRRFRYPRAANIRWVIFPVGSHRRKDVIGIGLVACEVLVRNRPAWRFNHREGRRKAGALSHRVRHESDVRCRCGGDDVVRRIMPAVPPDDGAKRPVAVEHLQVVAVAFADVPFGRASGQMERSERDVDAAQRLGGHLKDALHVLLVQLTGLVQNVRRAVCRQIDRFIALRHEVNGGGESEVAVGLIGLKSDQRKVVVDDDRSEGEGQISADLREPKSILQNASVEQLDVVERAVIGVLHAEVLKLHDDLLVNRRGDVPRAVQRTEVRRRCHDDVRRVNHR